MAVGRTVKRVTVAVRPGTTLLQLRATLSSGTLRTSQVLQLPRL